MQNEICASKRLRWLPDYAVGVEEIDREHQGLFALAEKLCVALKGGHEEEILLGLVGELVDSTCCHLAHEEELMERIQYPHYADHYSQHEDLRLRTGAMRERAAAGEIWMAVELIEFLAEWLKCHTTTSDRRIGSYMRKCGLVA